MVVQYTARFIYIRGGYSNSNSAEKGSGGFAYLANCQLSIFDHNISSNRASNGGAIYARDSLICIPEIYKRDIWAQNGYARDSLILIPANITMANNTAVHGGALYLNNSNINLDVNTHLYIDYNMANKGGAKNCEEFPDNFQCFFRDNYPPQVHFIFTNNSASQGPVLYGLLDRCHDSFKLGIDRMRNISDYA